MARYRLMSGSKLTKKEAALLELKWQAGYEYVGRSLFGSLHVSGHPSGQYEILYGWEKDFASMKSGHERKIADWLGIPGHIQMARSRQIAAQDPPKPMPKKSVSEKVAYMTKMMTHHDVVILRLKGVGETELCSTKELADLLSDLIGHYPGETK